MAPVLTPFARHLSRPEVVASADALISASFDQTIALRLRGAAGGIAPDAHLRRSFLAALGPAASEAARSGKPCTWDPPCALDVFCREQLRHKGAGLPKPYVLWAERHEEDLVIRLRVFGMANDWFAAAAEALAATAKTATIRSFRARCISVEILSLSGQFSPCQAGPTLAAKPTKGWEYSRCALCRCGDRGCGHPSQNGMMH